MKFFKAKMEIEKENILEGPLISKSIAKLESPNECESLLETITGVVKVEVDIDFKEENDPADGSIEEEMNVTKRKRVKKKYGEIRDGPASMQVIRCGECNVVIDFSDRLFVQTDLAEETATRYLCGVCSNKPTSARFVVNEIRDSILHQTTVESDNKKAIRTLNKKIKNPSGDSRKFKCDECDRKFATNQYLKIHTDVVHKNIRYTCTVCSAVLTTKFALNTHMQYRHMNKKKHPCEVCGQSFTTKQSRKYHVDVIHNNIRNFVCPDCNRPFPRLHQMNNHIDLVHKRRKDYTCTECNRAFSTKQYLKYHLDCAHKNMKNFFCADCERSFSAAHSLKTHRDRLHSSVKCEPCGLEFSSKNLLKEHTAKDHVDLQVFECSECLRNYPKKENLRKHINMMHANTKSFTCDECNRVFARKFDWKTHIENVHRNVRKFACSECDAAFTRNYYLKVHIDTYHLNIKHFLCNLCHRTFYQKPQLKTHLKAVHKINEEVEMEQYSTQLETDQSAESVADSMPSKKKFPCIECDSQFTRRYYLKVHIDRVHRQIRRFTCHICDRTFSHNPHLRSHLKKVHKISDTNKTLEEFTVKVEPPEDVINDGVDCI